MTQPTTDLAASTTEPDTTAPSATPDTEPDEATPTNSEAARYRVERNQARTERDALAERLTAYQRRECESVVAELLDVPADLWDIGQADITAFYNDDGTVNADDLRAAATALLENRPRLGKPTTIATPRAWGQHSEHGGGPGGSTGWSDVINPK